MVKIEQLDTTSTFAWNHDTLPLLATGSVAGAVDINFSASSKLEIWDVFTSKGQPIFSAPVDQRFHALAWSKPSEGRPRGILVGATQNGTVEFWDADVLIKSKDVQRALIHSSTKHSGPVKCLQFNPNQPHVLVTGGSNGQIFIWDTKTFADPVSPGQAISPMDEVTLVAWNNSVPHIFASTGNSGYTSIWDLKAKREVLHLAYVNPKTNGKANFSCVTWHPTQSTKLITASDTEGCPLILSWDLRNANAPERILEGHMTGVLSLDWCSKDVNLLLSSGKDNATFLWNPITGEKLGSYPSTTNWAFKVQFAPLAPDVFASASFDGKIVIQTLQDTTPPPEAPSTNVDDNTFWSEISSSQTQQPVFDKVQAPQWLVCPSSVSFGFGSKLVSITSANGKSIVKITKIATSGDTTKSDKLAQALNDNDFHELIEDKTSQPFINENDKADWDIIKQFSDLGKAQFLESIYGQRVESKESDILKGMDGDLLDSPVGNGGIDGGNESFFDNLSNGVTKEVDFTYSPSGKFSISDDESNHKLIQLILQNKIDDATDLCLKEDKLTEALILALDAETDVKEKVRSAYFKKHAGNTLSRILYSVASKNVTDIVSNADVSDWKEIAATISSFTNDDNEFDAKITELGDRVLATGSRINALQCYFAGGAIDRIAKIWIEELPQFEEELLSSQDGSITTPSDARFTSLNNFVEKLSAYRSVANFSGVFSGPNLLAISRVIIEYSSVVAGDGQFNLANKFLDLLPPEIVAKEKERISKASGVVPVVPVVATQAKRHPSTAIPRIPRRQSSYAAASFGFTPTNAPAALPVMAAQTQPGIPTNQYAPANPYAQPAVPAVPMMSTPTITGPPRAPLIVSTPVKSPIQNPALLAASIPRSITRQSYGTIAPIMPPIKPMSPTPASTFTSLYKPAVPAMGPPGVLSSPSPNPSKPWQENTDGWNDLPETFKQPAPPKRAAAVAVASPKPAQVKMVPTKPTPLPQAAPPPPKGSSRSASAASVTEKPAPQKPKESTRSNRYAPPPSSSAPSAVPSNLSTPPLTSSTSMSLPPKNPYAPPPPSKADIPRPKPQPIATSMTNVNSNLNFNSPASVPPKNPYAPLALQSVGIPQPHVHGKTTTPPAGKVGGPPPRIHSNSSSQASLAQPPPKVEAQKVEHPSPVQPPPKFNTRSPIGTSSRSQTPKVPEPEPELDPAAVSRINDYFKTVSAKIQPQVPEKFKAHALDMAKRLKFLYDALEKKKVSAPVVEILNEVVTSLESHDFKKAAELNSRISDKFPTQTGNWFIGVKRLINMSEAFA